MPTTPRPRWRASSEIQARARELRRAMTPAEQALWTRIRDGQLDGAHFRKQHAVGNFIVDFFCAKAKLVVEVDGDVHATQADYDAARTRWLEDQRQYQVIRFTNEDVFRRMDAVLEEIWEALKSSLQ
jgi:very-short-patch-repair endonuclease